MPRAKNTHGEHCPAPWVPSAGGSEAYAMELQEDDPSLVTDVSRTEKKEESLQQSLPRGSEPGTVAPSHCGQSSLSSASCCNSTDSESHGD
jgi:hypothetical protein